MPEYGLILTLTGGLSAALLFGYLTHRIGLSPIVGYLAGRAGRRTVHARVRGRRGPGGRAGRSGRHPADVRRRPAVSRRRAAGRAQHRASRRRDGKRRGHAARVPAGTRIRLGMGRVARVRHGARQSPARSCSCGCCPTTTICTRRPATSRWAGWSSRTCSRWWRWCCCRLSSARLPTARPCGWRSPCTALKVVALIAFTALVGTRVIPKFLDYIARTRSRELFTLAVLVIALSIAVGSAIAFSVSMALGAFLAGMVVGQSEHSLRAASDALPMRDAFAVLFFVSVGMLLDPRALTREPRAPARRARHRAGGEAAGGVRDRVGDALSTGRRDAGGGRVVADRRVLLHPVGGRPRAGHPDAGRDQHAGGDLDRLDCGQPADLSRSGPDTGTALHPVPMAAEAAAAPAPRACGPEGSAASVASG